MRSIYSALAFLAAVTPLLADEQSDCLAKASTTNGVIYWTGDEVPLNKVDGYGTVPGSNGTTKGCMELGQWDGQVRIGDQPHPVKDTRTILETNPVGEWASYDISYILGYSHPVVCKDTVQKTFTGDSKDLWNASSASCHEKNGYTCVGPVGPWGVHAPAMVGGTSCYNCNPPNPFFAPVSGAAYTYPDDNGAVIAASSNAIACCVGKSCKWKNPNAGKTKDGSCACNSGADKRDVAPKANHRPRRHLHGHGIHKVRGLSEVI